MGSGRSTTTCRSRAAPRLIRWVAKEVDDWGAARRPREATAFFPPDEPEGWLTKVPGARPSTTSTATEPTAGKCRVFRRRHLHQRIQRNQRCRTDVGSGQPTDGAERREQIGQSLGLLDAGEHLQRRKDELLSVLGPQHNVELEDAILKGTPGRRRYRALLLR